MNSNPENRDKTRFDYESAVTLENQKAGVQRSARMYNYSDHGLYLEADHLLEPETEIRIGITNSPFASEPDKFENYRGLIKWRKPLKRSVYNYAYGVEIIEEGTTQENDLDQYHGSRQHPRVAYAIPVKYESDNQTYEGTTENVSSGGVFIKTRDPIAVGQKVTIDIPLKIKGKIKRLTGKVTWSTRKGFGIKFIRSE
jgi:hypothetical protein